MSATVSTPIELNHSKKSKSGKVSKRQKWIPFSEFVGKDEDEDKINDSQQQQPRYNRFSSQRKENKDYKASKSSLALNTTLPSNNNFKSLDQRKYYNQLASAISGYSHTDSTEYTMNSSLFPYSPPPETTNENLEPYPLSQTYFPIPRGLFSTTSNDLSTGFNKNSRSKNLGEKYNNSNKKQFSKLSYPQDQYYSSNFENPISPLEPVSPIDEITPYLLNSANNYQYALTKPATKQEKIRDQLVYYFSVSNLCKDIYLRKLMNKNTGGISLSKLNEFKRLESLTNSNIKLLILVIKKYHNELGLELINDENEVRCINWKQWVWE